MPATLAMLLFPLLMAFAASTDLLTMRISNRVVIALVAGFLILVPFTGMDLLTFATHVACAGIVLVVAFAFFAMRWIGGGDAKLAAATALWLGFAQTLPYLVYAALLGGVLTLSILALRRWPLTPLMARFVWLSRLHDPKEGVPYGIALAASGLIIYSDTAIFHHFAG